MKAKCKIEVNFLYLEGKTKGEIEQFLESNGYDSFVDCNDNIQVWKYSDDNELKETYLYPEYEDYLVILDNEIGASFEAELPIILINRKEFLRVFEVINE